MRVTGLTIRRRKIVEVDTLSDPECLRRLDQAILDTAASIRIEPNENGSHRLGMRSRRCRDAAAAGFETAHIVGTSIEGYVALQVASRGVAETAVGLASRASRPFRS